MQKRVVKLVECPRDSMQGWSKIIPTQTKIDYLNALLKVGFNTLDFGSFVSPKAIPQMADTREVLKSLDIEQTNTHLLAIVANNKGIDQAVSESKVKFLGFPFSISETFQQRNTNTSILESFETVKYLRDSCLENNKEPVIYISMGFGNPYGDSFHESIVADWVDKISKEGIKIISIADTVGLATAPLINKLMVHLITSFPGNEIGVHLHSTPYNMAEKLDAALEAGCTRFDSAIKGIGGCPMAGNDLVGNMDTEFMVNHFQQKGFETGLDLDALKKASETALTVFN